MFKIQCYFSSSCVVLQKNNYTACNHSSNVVVRDFAQTILQHFPPNSIVLTKGDLPTNSLRSVLKFVASLFQMSVVFWSSVDLFRGWVALNVPKPGFGLSF